ncbi:MAG TPA: hypothetical protein DCF68_18610 [Cyanothece sp. UBA12306]|nr:hypothetical protein [Cyanothece sp. UBA12306]
MEPQLENQNLDNQKTENTLPLILDIVSGIGVFGGVVGSFFNNVALATIPVSVAVAMQMANRRKLAIDSAQTQQNSVVQISQKINQNQTVLSQQIQKFQQEIDNYINQQHQSYTEQIKKLSDNFDQTLEENIAALHKSIAEANQERDQLNNFAQEINDFTQNLDQQQQQIKSIVGELQKIENFSLLIDANTDQADAYYERGMSYQKLGNKEGAIQDYTEALHFDSTHAKAYHNRGILLAELDNKKQAVADLRLAAKYYFEQGDIDSYQQARDLSKEFYEVRHYIDDDISLQMSEDVPAQAKENESKADLLSTETISVGNLFS